MVYIKFTNGAVTKLVNVENEVAQNDAIDNGFYMIMDGEGVPEVVDSSELVRQENLDRANMIREVAKKLVNKSKNNMNSGSLYSRSM